MSYAIPRESFPFGIMQRAAGANRPNTTFVASSAAPARQQEVAPTPSPNDDQGSRNRDARRAGVAGTVAALLAVSAVTLGIATNLREERKQESLINAAADPQTGLFNCDATLKPAAGKKTILTAILGVNQEVKSQLDTRYDTFATDRRIGALTPDITGMRFAGKTGEAFTPNAKTINDNTSLQTNKGVQRDVLTYTFNGSLPKGAADGTTLQLTPGTVDVLQTEKIFVFGEADSELTRTTPGPIACRLTIAKTA